MSDPTQSTAERAGALMAWYAAMGVDAAVSEPATDWLQRPRAPPKRASDILQAHVPALKPIAAVGHGPQPSAVADRRTARPGPGDGTSHDRTPQRPVVPGQTAEAAPDATRAITDAGERAAAARSLAELRTAIEGFEGCALKKTARSVCFMRGAEQARLMVIGEAPGREEDRAGIPFVGRAGQLLDKMLAAIGQDDSNTHITNIVYWRPPGNRTPSDAEAQICRPFLDAQIAFVDPDLILAMGGAAAKLLTGEATGIMRLRGKTRTVTFGGRDRILLPTLHPAYLLRQPEEKRKAWQDLQAAKALLG